MSHVGNTPFMSRSYPAGMATVLLRLSLPDRPGALGAVASRIGAVRGDVVSIDIVGRDQGRAIDELVVDIGDERHLSLMLDEIGEVDGVQVDDVRVIPPGLLESHQTAVDAAIALMGASTPTAVLQVVAQHGVPLAEGAWSAVLDVEHNQILAAAGTPPAAAWLGAYVSGARWYDLARAGDRPLAAPGSSRDGAGASSAAGSSSAQPAGAISAAVGSAARAVGGAERPGTTRRRSAHRQSDAMPAWAPAPDVAYVPLQTWDLVLLAGRPGGAFTERERRHLGDLARLADARWSDLAVRSARLAHPSAHHGETHAAGLPIAGRTALAATS